MHWGCDYATALNMEVDSRQVVVVYYSITYFKAVRVGEGDSGRHVLRDTTSRGCCELVCPSRTSERGGTREHLRASQAHCV